ncbi:MAG: phosphoribosylglycinamide formyltransferase [Ferrovum sp.]|nr:phosphoribosylglycinamide formyltransferase [Ferrovum sp.]
MGSSRRVVILVSGRGSNMEALLAARLPIEVVAVISNRAAAAALPLAAAQGIVTRVVPSADFTDRIDYDEALRQVIDEYAPDLVVLAGFMRLLTPGFVNHYRQRLLNIRPSLLPAFTGLHTHRRALEEGVCVHGCTVHFVTDELDGGPIVAQGVVPVSSADDEESLGQRVLAVEHQLYPKVLQAWAEDRLHWVSPERVILRAEQENFPRVLWGK